MIGVETKLTGDIALQLDDFEREIHGKVLFAGVAAMAKVLYDEVKSNTEQHRRTGTLNEAIYRVYSKDRSTDVMKTYHISWNKKKAPHGHLVEFGTSKMSAQPFLRPAFDHVQEAITAGNQRMSEQISEIGDK